MTAPQDRRSPSFDSTQFRAVLGHFPTPVTIVTALDTRGPAPVPVGLTIGSFTSVSLDPPMVGFLPGASSETLRAIEHFGSFAVNELSADQAELCWRFASSGNEDERFAGLDWTAAPDSGSPLIPGALAWIDCEVEAIHEMGDHYFVLGHATSLENHPDSDTKRPMLFYRGDLGHFERGN